MARFFNTAGPCRPDLHYMLPAEARLPDLERLIERQQYFVVHAPRQVGKTTACLSLAQRLTAEGRYTALLTSCETGQRLVPDPDRSMAAVLDTLRQQAQAYLPEELRPPAADSALPAETRLQDLLSRWARRSPRPVVLFLDEIDALYDDALITVLRQLRSGYARRPGDFPQSVALIGLRDVRDYRLPVRDDHASLGTASPFNIKVRSFTLRNFTAEEVSDLYGQHTVETGQRWSPEAKTLAFELTGGQPWLVNALANEVVSEGVTDPAAPIQAADVERAKETLIERRDTHLDSLIDRLREPRVRRVIEPILAGEALTPDVLSDHVKLVEDLGLVRESPEGLVIANPIYQEIIPRALTELMEKSVALPRPSYTDAAGRLDFVRLLSDFEAFWRENAEVFLARAPYSEAAAQLVFLAFLHKVVNGGGFVDREYAAGRGRMDLLIRWPLPSGDVERWAVELKVWRDTTRFNPVDRGVEQLAAYLARLGLETGTLLVFDGRSGARPLPERMGREEVEHGGRRITVLRL
jgi:hypothetical protein